MQADETVQHQRRRQQHDHTDDLVKGHIGEAALETQQLRQAMIVIGQETTPEPVRDARRPGHYPGDGDEKLVMPSTKLTKTKIRSRQDCPSASRRSLLQKPVAGAG